MGGARLQLVLGQRSDLGEIAISVGEEAGGEQAGGGGEVEARGPLEHLQQVCSSRLQQVW